MLYFFSGSDRNAARAALDAAVQKAAGKGMATVRVTDAHTPDDIRAALAGPGMFGGPRVVVCDGIMGGTNDENRAQLIAALPGLKKSKEVFFVVEGVLLTDARKQFEKYSEESERFDAKKPAEEKTIFQLANALQSGDKKGLWLGLMREEAKGTVPEAVHGLLFWGAKQMLLRDGGTTRSRRLVAALAALPHESRRRGEELSYALERFALSGM